MTQGEPGRWAWHGAGAAMSGPGTRCHESQGDSHNFPELRRRLGPRPPPRTPAGLGQPRGEGGRGWNQPEAEKGVRRSGVQALRSLLILPQILPQLSSLAQPDAPSCIQKSAFSMLPWGGGRRPGRETHLSPGREGQMIWMEPLRCMMYLCSPRLRSLQELK